MGAVGVEPLDLGFVKPPAFRRSPPKEIKEVFLGATVRDLGSYRSHVQAALRKARAAIYLQEDWSEAAADVVDLSLGHLERSDAYMVLLGYRYGSIPPNRSQSITEIECRHALSLWEGIALPPIFFFIPEPDKEAARELKVLADKALMEECCDQAMREENERRQMAFHGFVRGRSKFCRTFATLGDLREWAISSIPTIR